MIKIENLSKSYGKKQVLKNINMEFVGGNIYGIVGENGAGKTTLFRCLAGLESYDGQIISSYNKLKNHLGLLLTEPFLFSKITGKEYIKLVTNARDVKIDNIEERNIFDLPLNQYATTYSTGMKKKLALTAILLQNNDVFIFDEPFNGIDIHSNILISEILKRLKDLNKTVIISSHIFYTLADNCDEIFVISKGEITKKVGKNEFNNLESEMKSFTIENQVERLGLI